MRLSTILGAGCFAAALMSLLFVHAQQGNEKPEAKPDKVKQVSIPKDQIYTTSGEPGFKKQLVALFRRDKDGREKGEYPYSYDLKMIEKVGMGASNVFIVRGEEIKDAVSATRLVFDRGVGAEEPRKYDAEDQEIVSKRYWLVIYLGTFGSEPPVWQFKSMSISDRTIEFAYSKIKPRIHTHDVWRYFYWIQLGQLRAGTYELRLVDSDKKRLSLIRYVDVR
jgi:hypothetical protein